MNSHYKFWSFLTSSEDCYLFIFRSSWDLPCLFTTTVFNSCEMIDVGHCLEISKSPEFPLSLFIVLLFTNQSSKTNSLKLWKQIFLQITFYKHSANPFVAYLFLYYAYRYERATNILKNVHFTSLTKELALQIIQIPFE